VEWVAWQEEYRDHPTQKPLALMHECLVRYPVETGGSIIDPFMGSGTTLVAAKDMGYPAIGIEIEEKYCEIAAKRLSQEVFDFTETK
jgi:DNA modification methylase